MVRKTESGCSDGGGAQTLYPIPAEWLYRLKERCHYPVHLELNIASAHRFFRLPMRSQEL